MLDIALLVLAGCVLLKQRSHDVILLFIYFLFSSSLVLLLKYMGVFSDLGMGWFLIYPAIIMFFIPFSRNTTVGFLFWLQQLVCLMIVIRWRNDINIFYSAHEYIVTVIYIMQLSCAYGYFDPLNFNNLNSLRVSLASIGPMSWKN